MSTEELPREDDLASLLVACDEALAAGSLAATLRSDSEASGELPRLQRNLGCVRLLRELWPAQRSRPSGPSPAVPGETLGRFVLGRELGSGGFGVVFLAYDPQLLREVALKVPRPEALLTPELRSRFQQEGRAAAGLDHPNIVPVYEAGEAGPISYIASAYCPGPTLAEWLRQRTEPVPVRDAAELVARLADAVQHAHTRGVLHRDLKPANVLLSISREPAASSLAAGSRLNGAIPKITDFGLAKCLDDADSTNPTRSGAVLGTPCYMAPEQATGRKRADVYALGIILYELLTGRPPFVGETPLDTLRQVRDSDPVSPTRLRSRLPRDLENICLKCLRKEPEKRYATAADLAADLGRYLGGRPVLARPAGATERLVKWVRRQPVVAALLALVILVTGLGVAGVVWQGLEAERGRKQAIQERDDKELARQAEERHRQEAEANLYAHSVALAYREWQANTLHRAEAVLDRCPAARRDWEWHYLRRLCRPELWTLPAGGPGGIALDFTPDGKRLASTHPDHSIRIWDVQSGRLVRTLTGHRHAVAELRISPDGSLLASGGGASSGTPEGELKVWDLATGREASLVGHRGAVSTLAFRPGQPQLASSGFDRTVRIWDVTTGKELRRLDGLRGRVPDLAYSPDGKTLVTAGDGLLVRLWDADTGQQRLSCRGHTREVSGVAFRPDGKLLASTSRDGTLRFWDPATGVLVRTTGEGAAAVFARTGDSPVRFSPDGREVVCLSRRRVPQIIDVETGSPKRLVRGRMEVISKLAWAREGRLLAAAGWSSRLGGGFQGAVLVWDLAADPESRVLLPGRVLGSPTVCGRGGRWVVRDEEETLRLYEARTGRAVRELPAVSPNVQDLAFSLDETRLAAALGGGVVQVWDTQTGEERRQFKAPVPRLGSVALDATGRLLAAGGSDGTVRVWDVETGQPRFTISGHQQSVSLLAFSPSARVLASADSRGGLKLWEATSGREVGELRGNPGRAARVAFSADGPGWRPPAPTTGYVSGMWPVVNCCARWRATAAG